MNSSEVTFRDANTTRDFGGIAPEFETLYFDFEPASQNRQVRFHVKCREQVIVAFDTGAKELKAEARRSNGAARVHTWDLSLQIVEPKSGSRTLWL